MRFFIQTFGCRLNRAESERTSDKLRAAGWFEVSHPAEAELILVNSCAVTGKAERGSRQFFSVVRATHPEAFLIAMGCATDGLAPGLYDMAISTMQKDRAAELLLARFGAGTCDGSERGATRLARGFLKVQDGCNGACSYCIVAKRRGAPRFRAPEAVIEEAKSLVERGVGEIVVTGCNLSLYPNLANLLERLIPLSQGVRWRIGSCEPSQEIVRLAELMTSTDRLCPYLHLPVQSGDDSILARMRRPYRQKELIGWIDTIRQLVPNLSLGGDFITGFPGESAEAFNATVDFIQVADFAHLHVFPYSERPGTDAPKLDGAIPPSQRKARAKQLTDQGLRQKEIWHRRWNRLNCSCVIESIDAAGNAKGWNEWYQPVSFPACGRQRGNLVKLSQVTLALGSNLGNRELHIRRAVENLARIGVILETAPNYENNAREFSGPPFLNTVLRLRTVLPPLELLHACQQIEVELGRPANHSPLQSRTIDIDLIDWQGTTLDTPELVLPHPRALQRDFVQIPLSQLAPAETPRPF